MADLLTFATAFVLGFVHALDVDHMVAVSAFVGTRPSRALALRFGLRWGLGHSIAVVGAGSLLLLSGLRWSPRFDAVAEAAVGLMLIGVGLWSLRTIRNLHLHGSPGHGDHAHLHVHPRAEAHHDHSHHDHGERHHHPHGITAVGLLHGLAGTSAVLALVPLPLLPEAAIGLGYLLAFSAGVIAGMILFAMVMASALRHAAERSIVWGRKISQLIAIASILIGLVWLVRAR
jgi:ABC-type nickel/cobalt efflux system permease component RcnA